MKIFEQYKINKQLIEKTKFVKIYKCDFDGKEYRIVLTKKSANKYSIIHCKDEHIVWQQVPRLFNWGGKAIGTTNVIYKFVQDKNCVTIFIIRGKPNGITGLDDGAFRCANNFDEDYINVMSYSRFKKL